MISISEVAADRIRGLLDKEGKGADYGLRVKVVGGGCSGLQYKLELDTPRQGDKVFERDGAKVLLDRKSFLYVNGTELDYRDDLMQSGFNLQNPNVKRACGCGASFTV
jgi:iron-sulfur cluster assembly protein